MRFSSLVNGNNRRSLLDGRNEMQTPAKIRDLKEKIDVGAEEVLQDGIGYYVWTGSGVR